MRNGRAWLHLALVSGLAACAARSSAVLDGPGGSRTLELVAHHDLGGGGLHGAIAVVGTTALVAGGITPAAGIHTHFYNPYPCPGVAVKVVDLRDPARPLVRSSIAMPPGTAAADVAALRVRGASFEGDLAAIAIAQCNLTGSYSERGVVYYDVSEPAAPRLLGRYHADADSVHPADVPPCGAPPAGSGKRCASSQHSVRLVRQSDGRVLSISTEPGASASSFPSGDLRIVDVTTPERPAQIGAFPGRGAPIFSSNGCRPFSAAHDATANAHGTRTYLAWFDGGVHAVDIGRPGEPRMVGQFRYDTARAVEGNAAFVTTGTDARGRDVVLLSEEDWIAPNTVLRFDGGALSGTRVACEAMFTLFAPDDDAALYRKPGASVSGPVVYLGRGCPANPGDGMHAGTDHTDPYPGDPRGAIAFLDRTAQSLQPGISRGAGCSVADRARRAQDAGAIAVVIGQTVATAPLAFSPDGDPRGLTIPVVQIDKGIADTLRTTLCAAMDASGRCAGSALRATLTDAPGEWGALRLLDALNDGGLRERWSYRTPAARQFPPRGLGVHAPSRAMITNGQAYVAWNSDGVRVLHLGETAREIASFIPPDAADPQGVLPARAYVTGVATFAVGGRTYVAITDLNGGLYVLR